MIVLALFSLLVSAHATPIPYLKLMLEHRAYVEDIRAIVHPPLPSEYIKLGEFRSINRQRVHALELQIETLVMNLFTDFGKFHDSLPVLPRLVIHVDVKHSDIEEPQWANDNEQTRIVNGQLRVQFVPRGEQIVGIPIRFLATTEVWGDYYGFKSVEMLDLDGKSVNSTPRDGKKRLLHLFNEGLLLNALHDYGPDCALLFL